MTHNCLKLNQDKTEWLIFNGDAISRNVTLTVGEHNIKQSAHIRNCGVLLEERSRLSLKFQTYANPRITTLDGSTK